MTFFQFLKKPIYVRPLYLLYIFNLIILFGIVFGALPRDFILGDAFLILLFLSLMSLQDGIIFFLASIPFFVALPLGCNFDALNLWRLAILILFGRLFFRKFPFSLWFKKRFWRELPQKIYERLRSHQIELWVVIYLTLMLLSVLVAHDKIIALKRFFYLSEMVLVYPLIINIAHHKNVLREIVKAFLFSVGLVLLIGFGQLVLTYFMSLGSFWDWWVDHFSYNFYGQHLAQIVKHANTWFSYYSGRPPTLRMFSTFTDSHSFALYLLLASPLLLWRIFRDWLQRHKKPFLTASLIGFFGMIQLAIMLSGTRGIWISVALPLLVSFFLLFSKTKKLIGKFIFGGLILFLIMLPLSSLVLSVPQFKIQTQDHQVVDKTLALKRLSTVVDLNETSNKGRLYIWKKSIQAILRYPLLGVGIGNFPVVLGQKPILQKAGSTAHDVYLNSGVEMGIFGLVAIVMIFYQILRLCWRSRINYSEQNKDTFWLPFILGFYFLWVFVYSLFDVALFDARVMMFFAAEVAMVVAITTKKQAAELK